MDDLEFALLGDIASRSHDGDVWVPLSSWKIALERISSSGAIVLGFDGAVLLPHGMVQARMDLIADFSADATDLSALSSLVASREVLDEWSRARDASDVVVSFVLKSGPGKPDKS